jgi:AraC-like DNA-binding protein
MKSAYALRDYTDIQDFPFSIVKLVHDGDVDIHGHDFTELVVVTGGKALHRVDDEEYPLRFGDVFVVPENGRHGYCRAEGLELVNIMFDLDSFLRTNPEFKTLPGFHSLFFLEPCFRKDHHFESRLTLGPEDIGFSATLTSLLLGEFHNRTEGYRRVIQTYLHAFLVFLARRFSEPRNAISLKMHRIAGSLSYLERHFREDISIRNLAELAFLSSRQYGRVFKTLFMCSPKSYLIKLRLEYACTLLRGGTLDITRIALASGFPSPSLFSRQFKGYYGIPPRQYRTGLHEP